MTGSTTGSRQAASTPISSISCISGPCPDLQSLNPEASMQDPPGDDIRSSRAVYPLSIEQFQQGFDQLNSAGVHLNGMQSKVKRHAYFQKFQVLGVSIGGRLDFDSHELIKNRSAELVVECLEHGTRFLSSPRTLFNTSPGYRHITCRQCERDALVGSPFLTLGELAQHLQVNPDVDFLLDQDELPTLGWSLQHIPKSTDYLPLICKHHQISTEALCGTRVRHKLSNVLTALNKNARHICCQGACDSKGKGKALRISSNELRDRLMSKRAGVWALPHEGKGFVKASTKTEFLHVECGFKVERVADQILNYPAMHGLPANTDLDCPHCSASSAFWSLGRDPIKLDKWLVHQTEGHLSLTDTSRYPESHESISVTCSKTANTFNATTSSLQINKFHGCIACQKTAATNQRAWRLDEAQELVQRRGFKLKNDPGSYIDTAEMLGQDGNTAQYTNILDLLKALPMNSGGSFGRRSEPDNQLTASGSRAGEPYSVQDDTVLQSMIDAKTWRSQDIADQLGRSCGSVSQRMRHLGLFNNSLHVRHSSLNDAAFSKVTPEACYFGGLLATDGNIKSDPQQDGAGPLGTGIGQLEKSDCSRRKSIGLELKAIDENVVAAFLHFVGSNLSLCYRATANLQGRGVYCGTSIRSTQIFQDLHLHFNLTSVKTHNLQPPILEATECKRAFLVGLLEGDGHIKVAAHKNELKISLISASRSMMDWYIQAASELTGLALPPARLIVRETGPHWTSEVTGKKAAALGRELLVFEGQMKRKWSILRDYLHLQTSLTD
jgi:hypothetical protein